MDLGLLPPCHRYWPGGRWKRILGPTTAIMPAPAYVPARAAWIPTLVIWKADGRFTRLEGAPCADYAAAHHARSPSQANLAADRSSGYRDNNDLRTMLRATAFWMVRS